MLDGVLRGLRRVHQAIETADSRLRAFDAEFKKGHNPLRSVLRVAETRLEKANSRVMAIGGSATLTKPPPGECPGCPKPADLPSTAETVQELKDRLAKELLRLESDLLAGARIMGKPCDCLRKHSLTLTAMTEELMTMDRGQVYHELLSWAQKHDYSAASVAEHPPEFFQGLVPEVRQLRKRIMGTAQAVSAAHAG